MIRPDPRLPRNRNRKNSRATTQSEDSKSVVVDVGEEVFSDKGAGIEEISSLTKKMSILNFIPRGVRFGRGQRGGFRR